MLRRCAAAAAVTALVATAAGCRGPRAIRGETIEADTTTTATTSNPTLPVFTAPPTVMTPPTISFPAPAPGSDAPRLAIVLRAGREDGEWERAARDAGASLERGGVISQLEVRDEIAEGAEAREILRALAAKGFDPIIAHSFHYADDVDLVASEYPNTLFVYAGGAGDVHGNVGDYSQRFHEPAYLEGILAAGATDGTISAVAGFDTPNCRSFVNSFVAGAREIDAGATVRYTSVDSWTDEVAAEDAARTAAAAGARIFIGCGFAPTIGGVVAAAEVDGVALGYIADMSDRGLSVLASFRWNLDAVFELMVADVVAGRAEARYYEVPLRDGGFDVVINPDSRHTVSTEALALYERRLAEIERGIFVVAADES